MPAAPFTHLTIAPDAHVYVSTWAAAWPSSMERPGGRGGSRRIDGQQPDPCLVETADGFVWIANDLGVQQMSPADPPFSGSTPWRMAEFLSTMCVCWPPDVGGSLDWRSGAAILTEATGRSLPLEDGLAGSARPSHGPRQPVARLDRHQDRSEHLERRIFFNLTQENGLPSDNITALWPTAMPCGLAATAADSTTSRATSCRSIG